MVPLIGRIVTAAGALVAGLAVALATVPGVAQAAPAAPKAAARLTTAQITGKDLGNQKLTIQQTDNPQLFKLLIDEVGWLANAAPQTSAPKVNKLGPKYTITLLAKNAAQQTYDLYPLASGGPRAHRPKKQPTGNKADGWFYGRLTMSESLRKAGAPLEKKGDVVGGGIGGGVGEQVSDDELDPVAGVSDFLAQMRELFLLNGAVLILILGGLAGISFMIRRRV
jgi:hypothetical protein